MIMEQFTIRLADKNIKICSNHAYCCKKCRDYFTETDSIDITAETTEAEITETKGELEGLSAGYAEHLCIYRSIAEQLPAQNRLVFHGAVITFQEEGYLFTAPSGTGKTTHIRLWKKYLGQAVDIVNGDKPILSVEKDNVRAHGTPWAGKENWQKNRSAVIKGICFIRQSKENRIRRIHPAEYLVPLMGQVYLPKDEKAAGYTLELLDDMVGRVPLYLLECDMSREAVKTSFEELTGLEYDKYEVKHASDTAF